MILHKMQLASDAVRPPIQLIKPNTVPVAFMAAHLAQEVHLSALVPDLRAGSYPRGKDSETTSDKVNLAGYKLVALMALWPGREELVMARSAEKRGKDETAAAVKKVKATDKPTGGARGA